MRQNRDLNVYRVRDGRLASDDSLGNVGAFQIPHRQAALQIICGDGLGWDHISVVPIDLKRLRPLYRCPSWEEMCYAKALFFGADETAVQYHPAKHLYRNCHQYALHIWRPQVLELPLPDPEMVGPA